jgi:pimeloyl-ACP methyl ester carboxylesterase
VLGLLLTGLALVLWLAASFAVAYRLTRRHRPAFREPVPAVSWAKLESHQLRTCDGQELGAWLIRGSEQAPSVVLLHGNGGSRVQCLRRAEMLAAEGCTLLMVSLRAHGDSTGELNDIGYGARHDVVAAVEFLERWRPGKPIIIHGSSLGAAAALFASEVLDHRVAGYILESPYKDLRTAVWNRTENALPPVLDWIAYRGLLAAAALVLPHWERISPLKAASGIPADVPVLILAGSEDRSARPEEARALHDRIRPHARLILFEHGGHMNFPDIAPERYRQSLQGFLRSLRHESQRGASPRASWHPAEKQTTCRAAFERRINLTYSPDRGLARPV